MGNELKGQQSYGTSSHQYKGECSRFIYEGIEWIPVFQSEKYNLDQDVYNQIMTEFYHWGGEFKDKSIGNDTLTYWEQFIQSSSAKSMSLREFAVIEMCNL